MDGRQRSRSLLLSIHASLLTWIWSRPVTLPFRCGGRGRRCHLGSRGLWRGIWKERCILWLANLPHILIKNHGPGPHGTQKIGVESSVENVGGACDVGLQSAVLGWKVVILLFVHFFIDDILFGDAKTSASSFLVNLRCTSRRFNTSFQTAITAARSSNVGSVNPLDDVLLVTVSSSAPLLVLFVSSLCLNRSARTDGGSQWRH